MIVWGSVILFIGAFICSFIHSMSHYFIHYVPSLELGAENFRMKNPNARNANKSCCYLFLPSIYVKCHITVASYQMDTQITTRIYQRCKE